MEHEKYRQYIARVPLKTSSRELLQGCAFHIHYSFFFIAEEDLHSAVQLLTSQRLLIYLGCYYMEPLVRIIRELN